MESRQFPADGQITQVGVIGGGQLAKMMAEAAQGLGISLVVQTPYVTDPAVRACSQFGGREQTVILASVDDAEATARLAQRCQVITFENEFVNVPALQQLEAQGVCFRPSLSVLAKLLDKYEQRRFLQALNLPVPLFASLAPQDDPQALGFKFPVVLKSRRHGYDGQGTFIVETPEALQAFWQQFQGLSDLDHRFMVEAFVPFERELAIMAARSAIGEVALYPVVETYQKQAVCRWVIAPTTIPLIAQTQIQTLVMGLLDTLDVVGIFGIELFLLPNGSVLINEIAPRTHNSGHLTIEACATSQFEQHLRAVCSLPLGNPLLKSAGAVMVNLLGFETAQSDYWEKRQRIEVDLNATVHWYGKTEAKPGRKLGHATLLLETSDRGGAIALAQKIESLWYPMSQYSPNLSL